MATKMTAAQRRKFEADLGRESRNDRPRAKSKPNPIKNGLRSSEAAGIQVKSGPSSNLAQAAKLKSQANSINAKYGRNRFQVGAGLLNQAVDRGGLTKAGKVSKAQVKAARQTAKNILGSSES